jgi:hypothetical protein
MYFLCSNFWRCLLAVAVSKEITLSWRSNKEAVGRLCAMVMSAPIVVYGQGVWILSVVIGSGSKDTSKGYAVMSEVLMFFSQYSRWIRIKCILLLKEPVAKLMPMNLA